jgi:CHAT domain-containing protein
LKRGDVLLTYNGTALRKSDDLTTVPERGEPVSIDVWRDGQITRCALAPGKLGVAIDPRPAPEAIAANRAINTVLETARSGDEQFVPLAGTRSEVAALAQLFKADDRRTKILLGTEASEPELDRVASSGELGTFGFIHVATHGMIDEGVPARSAVILTQTGLPDPLQQVLDHKPVFDGRLSVREIQRGWDLNAELVTLSACETALGRFAGGEGFVGFTQALLISGTRSVCLSLWKVDDRATSLFMRRFYENLLGKRHGMARPLRKGEALAEAKVWLRGLDAAQAEHALEDAGLTRGETRKSKLGHAATPLRPYEHPYYWAAFVLVGDPD